MKSKAKQAPTYEEICRKAFDTYLDFVGNNPYEKATATPIPFREILKLPQHREALYKQFLTAPVKSCYKFYSDKHSQLTQEEEDIWNHKKTSETISRGQVESKIRKEIIEFERLCVAKSLPKDCYIPDIYATPMIATLRKVENDFDLFQKSITDPQADRYKEAELTSEIIIDGLGELNNPSLMNNVINKLRGAENMDITIRHLAVHWARNNPHNPQEERKERERWKVFQRHFDHLLKKGLQQTDSIIDEDPLNSPLCNCIQPIVDKYIAIRDAAMQADEDDNPGKGFFEINPVKAKTAITQNAGSYFLELISALHKEDCPTYREILRYVDMSRQMCLIKKQGPKIVFERHIAEWVDKRLKSIEDNEKRLKEHTGTLSAIGRTWVYWARLSSIEHLKMYETVGDAELLPNNNKQAEAAPKAKFFALYHRILIEMGREKPFPKNENDQFIKKAILATAEALYSKKGCGPEGFYKDFRKVDLSNKQHFSKPKYFGNGYKAKLIAISGNDEGFIAHLKSYPD